MDNPELGPSNNRNVDMGIDEFLTEIRLRAEYDFERMWERMKERGTLPIFGEKLKGFIKRVHLNGAESAALSLLEMLAQHLQE